MGLRSCFTLRDVSPPFQAKLEYCCKEFHCALMQRELILNVTDVKFEINYNLETEWVFF